MPLRCDRCGLGWETPIKLRQHQEACTKGAAAELNLSADDNAVSAPPYLSLHQPHSLCTEASAMPHAHHRRCRWVLSLEPLSCSSFVLAERQREVGLKGSQKTPKAKMVHALAMAGSTTGEVYLQYSC